MLQRQALISRGRKFVSRKINIQPCPSSSQSKPLHIILEEDLSRSSSLSSCYSVCTSAEESLSAKARRRHATITFTDSTLSRVLPDLDDNDDLCSPRPAPRPPCTPSSQTSRSYRRDSECCNSPTQSSSSLSSSPDSQTEGMPATPVTSDDEFDPPHISRRPVIQPLVITKYNSRSSSPYDCAISHSPLNIAESSTLPSPTSPTLPSYLPEEFWYESDEPSDSEPDSDSEWYTKEISKVISLPSSFPPSSSLQTRPDSMSISPAVITPSRRRFLKPLPRTPRPLPQTPSSCGSPNSASPASSKRRSIPNYPPPPIPTVPSLPVDSSPHSSPLIPLIQTFPFSPVDSSPSPLITPARSSLRPPPRSSIPADCDCVLNHADVDVEDSSSIFSFSIYDVYLGDEPDRPDRPDSPPSYYSQSSADDPIDGVTFDLDYPMMLPLSLPTTPFDLDIAKGLEQLRSLPNDSQAVTGDSAQPETQEPEQQTQEVVVEPLRQQQPQVIDDVFSPSSTTFLLHAEYAGPTNPSDSNIVNEEKTLKSRWSSSTLGSVREEHQNRGASARLRLYFGGQLSPRHAKRGNSKPTKTSISPISLLPISGLGRKASAPTAASATRLPSKATPGLTRANSDLMVIGYGRDRNSGVRRRGSVTNSLSDAGSEESCSSTSSSGLRRKPIPVEMFLRSSV